MEDSFNKLSRHGEIVGALWPFLFNLDPNELLIDSEKMIIQLARYGRQSVLQWDDVEVGQIRRWHARLKELIDSENAVTKEHED